jgi:hypothetical protein
MSDVQGLVDSVFAEDWLEGNQMHVATATISDYMKDFKEYLVPFWADKFVMTILEAVIVGYTRSLVFRGDRRLVKSGYNSTGTGTTDSMAYTDTASGTSNIQISLSSNTNSSTGPGASAAPSNNNGFFSSFFKSTSQQISQAITKLATAPINVFDSSVFGLGQRVHVSVDEESLGRLAQDVNILIQRLL